MCCAAAYGAPGEHGTLLHVVPGAGSCRVWPGASVSCAPPGGPFFLHTLWEQASGRHLACLLAPPHPSSLTLTTSLVATRSGLQRRGNQETQPRRGAGVMATIDVTHGWLQSILVRQPI